MEPTVTGTPEQLLLLTLAEKIDGMDAKLEALASRIPDRCKMMRLADTMPARLETAEEEGDRVARVLRDPDAQAMRGDRSCYLGLDGMKHMRVGSLRHEENKKALARNGFTIVAESDAPGSGGEALVRWKPSM